MHTRIQRYGPADARFGPAESHTRKQQYDPADAQYGPADAQYESADAQYGPAHIHTRALTGSSLCSISFACFSKSSILRGISSLELSRTSDSLLSKSALALTMGTCVQFQ